MELVKKIDLHTHAIAEKGLGYPGLGCMTTPEELIAYYDRIGVEKAVLLPITTYEGGYEVNTHREIVSIVKKYPDRFLWFCNPDPRMGLNDENTDFVRILNFYKAQGAKGVGEMTANIPFDDPRTLKLFAACEECGLPVLFHVGKQGGDYGLVDDLGLYKLEKVLQMFPKLTFIGHSQKFWSEISGDVTEQIRNTYPVGKIVPGGRLLTLLRKYPNLHCDLSAGSGYNSMARDPEHAYKFLEEFQDRVYFGLDVCLPDNMDSPSLQHYRFLDEAVTRGKISYDAYLKICRRNAIRLLQLEA